MCGLLYTNIDFEEKEFLRALGLMSHRGPDASDHYFQSQHKFGHNRLKILDLNDASNQPFFSEDNRYLIIFNGEIFNFKELAEEYCLNLKTTSDTEVLLKLFIRFGENMLQKLNGMFAFVIYDHESDELFVARDRLGIKPLYIHQSGNEVIISSEINALVYLRKDNKIDDLGRRQYLKLRTFFNNRTIYEGVKFFPAGHYMKQGKMIKYWDYPETEQEPPSIDELNELVTAAVERWKIADVSVGSFLSGGLDSTIVTALSNTEHSWTSGFKSMNEFEWGRLASEHIKTQHHELEVDKDLFKDTLDSMIAIRKEPLSVPNEVMLYLMSKKASEYNTVIMAGEGADELFFGYDRIFRWASSAEKWNLEEFTKHYAYGAKDDYEIIDEIISPFVKKFKEPIKIVSAFFQTDHLHGLLRRLDNSTMLASIEARVPFVDHTLIERLAGVSFDWKMQNGIVKDPLKKAFRSVIPHQIIDRKKVGFPVPLELIEFNQHNSNSNQYDNWLKYNLEKLFSS